MHNIGDRSCVSPGVMLRRCPCQSTWMAMAAIASSWSRCGSSPLVSTSSTTQRDGSTDSAAPKRLRSQFTQFSQRILTLVVQLQTLLQRTRNAKRLPEDAPVNVIEAVHPDVIGLLRRRRAFQLHA